MISAVAPGLASALGGGPDGRGGSAPVTPAAITQSQTVLSPPQVTALQQIQKRQQTQDQLRQLVNDTLAANQPGPPRGGPAPSGAGNNPPPRKR